MTLAEFGTPDGTSPLVVSYERRNLVPVGWTLSELETEGEEDEPQIHPTLSG